MLVNIYHDSPAEHRRLVVAGVAFLRGIALLVALSIAVYQKAFERGHDGDDQGRPGRTPARRSSATSGSTARWSARSARSTRTARRRSITVALEPEEAEQIPDNVSVQILPTTLFGQKFVSFVRPDDPSSTPIADGAVIPASRVETNVELSRILANLFPLLRAVRPADLNATLNALATALGGRGEQLGETMDELDTYIGEISDHLPTLRQDLIKLADVADTYDLAAPDLLAVLRNVTTTGADGDRQQGADRRLLLRPPGPGRHLVAGARRQRDQHDPGRPGHRAGAPAARGLLARVALPAQGRRRATRPGWPGPSRATRSSSTSSSAPPQYRAYDERDRPTTARSATGRGAWVCPTRRCPRRRSRSTRAADIDENPPTSPLPTGLRPDPRAGPGRCRLLRQRGRAADPQRACWRERTGASPTSTARSAP